MPYSVRVTGLDWWEKRVIYFSSGGLEKEAVMPAMKELSNQFRKTLTTLFKPGGGKGTAYEHGYTGKYLMGLYNVVTGEGLKIIEGNPKGGKEIREGGKPGSWLDVYLWARRKLQVDAPDAKRIATALQKRGYIGGGSSPLKLEYPSGAPKFSFPEWIVTIKNKDDIDKAARSVESLTVRYLR